MTGEAPCLAFPGTMAEGPPRSPPLRIWLDVGLCGANPTGIPRATRNLALALRNHGSAFGLDVQWVASDPSGTRLLPLQSLPQPPGNKTGLGRLLAFARGLPLPPWLRGCAMRGLHWWQSRRQLTQSLSLPLPDVLVLPHAGSPGLPKGAISELRARGCAVAAFCWDILPLTRPELFYPQDHDAFAHSFHWLLPHLDVLLLGSHATEQDLRVWAHQQGVSLPPLAVVGAVIDVPPPAQTLWQRLGLLETVPVVLMVGAFVPRKQHMLALAAMERLWAEGQHVVLLCIGPPHPLGKAVLAHLRAHPDYGHRLLVVHDASDAEVAEAYRHASLAIMPSEAEGFGMPIAEALLSGCPVLCADIPVFREIAGDAATLLPVGDPDSWASALRHHLTSRTEPLVPAHTFRTRWRDAPLHNVLHILRAAAPNDTR